MFLKLINIFNNIIHPSEKIGTSIENCHVSWDEIEGFEKWVQTQPNAVIEDILCRFSLRLLPTLFAEVVTINDGQGFHQTLNAGIDILAFRIDLSCGRPRRIRAMDGASFYRICGGADGEHVGSVWHAIESTADSFGSGFMKKYLSEVNANIRRRAPGDHGQFFRALLVDSAVWEVWAKEGADNRTRAELMMSPLWTESTPAEIYTEGLPKLVEFLRLDGGYSRGLLLSAYDNI